MTDFRALCAELVVELQAWEQADYQLSCTTIRADADYQLVPRALAALAAELDLDGRSTPPATEESSAAEGLSARSLLEEVSKLSDVIDTVTVGRIMELATSAEAWLRDNPPGQPIAIEPRGCPAPGAQAVLDAFNSAARPEPHHQREAIAAALRAAADQVVPANGSRRNNEVRAELLAIAAELEG